jgi:threonine dehydratase
MSSAPAACPTFDQVVSAARRIESGIIRTPCVRSAALSELCRAEIWCKLDYLQSTGSFKERGGRNALLQLDAAARAKGVIAASAGNHALALAYHGRSLGISVTVVMPQFAPLVKQVRCRELGARVLVHGQVPPPTFKTKPQTSNRTARTSPTRGKKQTSLLQPRA